MSNPKLADLVSVSKDYVIYRDCGVGLTVRGKAQPAAAQFAQFLQSREGAAIFKKWGWMAP